MGKVDHGHNPSFTQDSYVTRITELRNYAKNRGFPNEIQCRDVSKEVAELVAKNLGIEVLACDENRFFVKSPGDEALVNERIKFFEDKAKDQIDFKQRKKRENEEEKPYRTSGRNR